MYIRFFGCLNNVKTMSRNPRNVLRCFRNIQEESEYHLIRPARKLAWNVSQTNFLSWNDALCVGPRVFRYNNLYGPDEINSNWKTRRIPETKTGKTTTINEWTNEIWKAITHEMKCYDWNTDEWRRRAEIFKEKSGVLLNSKREYVTDGEALLNMKNMLACELQYRTYRRD